LEIQDIMTPHRCHDDTLKGTSLEKWGGLLLEASIKLGIPLNSALTVKKIMEETGYVDVVEVIYQWPMNKWPADKRMKEIGMGIPLEWAEIRILGKYWSWGRRLGSWSDSQ
jgi:hypothetical protein